ncbi:hypothetical protein Bbelb_377790 [Branchiostoma belcheri]|nr:hypothetical protein Bbelb_377790 [Branchiostoma belcheri]
MLENEGLLTEEQKSRLCFTFEQARLAVHNWKAHLLRSVNQDLAKYSSLQQLDPQSALIVMDWAMKFLPLKYREQMTDFFGKRGRSWHVAAVITKGDDEKYNVESFVHIFNNCRQDWAAVCAIVQSVLQTIKSENPALSRVFLRSDNAVCYHCAPLILSLPAISRKTGISVQRFDFSDPQAGKDICDRKIASMKTHIRRYVNEKHDVLTADDMKEALESHGGIKGCRVASHTSHITAPTGGAASLLFYCPEPGCVAAFSSTNKLEDHMDVGQHLKELERESTYDKIRKNWAQAVTGIAHGPDLAPQSRAPGEESGVDITVSSAETTEEHRICDIDTDMEAIEEEGEWQALRKTVYTSIDYSHPVMFEDINLCQLANTKGLKSLKLKELKCITDHFHLHVTGSTARKDTFIQALKPIIGTCPCAN